MFTKENFKCISGIKDIRNLPWHDFEWFCKFFLEYLGFERIRVTKPKYDGGVDLIVWKNNQKYLVQAKNWREDWFPVSVVRELGGVMKRWEMTRKESVKGIIITTAPSFQTAEKEAKDLGIIILNKEKIDRYMSNIFQKENIVYFKKKSIRSSGVFQKKTISKAF